MKLKRKILWFSSVQFSDEKIKTTGTWLIAMGDFLSNNTDIELYNVTYGNVQSITQKNTNSVTQWVVPHKERTQYHKGSKELISFIRRISNEVNPDLIHIWGTESGFGFAVNEAKINIPILLDIQGLFFTYSKFYYGGLSVRDLYGCIGVKEVLRPNNHPYFIRKKFIHRGKHELRLIQSIDNISVQSDWVDSIIGYVTSGKNIFHTGMMLRREFYETPIWEPQKESQFINIFTSCSGAIPYKGMHVLFEAISLLKDKYPNIRLNIGGNIQIHKKYGVIRDGYTSWLLKKADKLGITSMITWLGMMDADEMIQEMHRSSLVVIPSFVETYCLFMAESMMVGVPTVASFAGALPQLAKEEESALYFPSGDQWTCARQIERIINNNELAKKLSEKARNTALLRNNSAKVLQAQLEIYNKIIDA